MLCWSMEKPPFLNICHVLWSCKLKRKQYSYNLLYSGIYTQQITADINNNMRDHERCFMQVCFISRTCSFTLNLFQQMLKIAPDCCWACSYLSLLRDEEGNLPHTNTQYCILHPSPTLMIVQPKPNLLLYCSIALHSMCYSYVTNE